MAGRQRYFTLPRPDPAVGGSVDGGLEHPPLERNVVRHHCGREVVVHALAGLQDQIEFVIAVLGHHLSIEAQKRY